MLIQADARRIPLADGSCHMCVTSPPYWSLRDYGLPPSIFGGDPECEHVWGDELTAKANDSNHGAMEWTTGGDPAAKVLGKKPSQGSFCTLCNAWRGCLGLEPTPELYVEHMVEVFREVRRVLRDDGTCWVNLGSSYASGRLAQSVAAYGNGGIGRPDLPEYDHAYSHCGDAHQDGSRNHHARKFRNGQELHGSEPRPSLIARDNEPGDSALASPGVSSLDAQESTKLSSPHCAQGASGLEDAALACPRGLQTSSGDVPSCAGRGGCNSCIAGLPLTSGHRRLDNSLFVAACGDPFCKGDRGICWAYYTIPSLKLKTKDLVSIPWLVAFALQADGWWLRSDIIWHKPNPMPESVTDRPTKSHEYLFLLTKSKRYFYDAEAIKEPQTQSSRDRSKYKWAGRTDDLSDGARTGSTFRRMAESGEPIATIPQDGKRNKRTVWTIPTRGYSGAHFATYPPALVEPCILAGTSARGCCPKCGSPWERVVEKVAEDIPHYKSKTDGYDYAQYGESPTTTLRANTRNATTTGWRPTCDCGHEDTIPCLVLDPFAGSGTTGMVAIKHGRGFVGLDLNGEYLHELATERLSKIQVNLF